MDEENQIEQETEEISPPVFPELSMGSITDEKVLEEEQKESQP